MRLAGSCFVLGACFVEGGAGAGEAGGVESALEAGSVRAVSRVGEVLEVVGEVGPAVVV